MREKRSREKGSALLFVLLALTTLSLLALLGIFSAQTDLLIAARMKKERVLRYEAELALDSALASLNTPAPPNLPEEVFSPPWPWPEPIRVSAASGERTIGWCLSPLPDSGDRDNDTSTPLVLYDRSFGYEEAPVGRGGCPVFQVNVLVEEVNAAQALVAEVTPRCLYPPVRAAWLAAGATFLEGRVHVSGFDHDEEGIVRAERSGDLPGILAAGEVGVAAGVHVVGEPSGVAYVESDFDLPEDPLEMLNGGATLTALDGLPGSAEGSGLQGMTYIDETFTGPLSGEGVLVVHNPLFRPGPYEASRLFFEEGIVTEDFDPDYSHLDSRLQPALLDIQAGGLFEGLVVADALGSVFDDATILGGLITLSRSPRPVTAAAPLVVHFSSRSLARASRGPLVHRLAQKAFDIPPEEFCRE